MTVWVLVTGPDYDNYAFDLYASRESAMEAIKASVGEEDGEWEERHEGTEITFQALTPVRRQPSGRKRTWSLDEQEVEGAVPSLSLRATSEVALLRVLLRRHLRHADAKGARRLLDELEQLP